MAGVDEEAATKMLQRATEGGVAAEPEAEKEPAVEGKIGKDL